MHRLCFSDYRMVSIQLSSIQLSCFSQYSPIVMGSNRPRVETSVVDFAKTARRAIVTYAGCYDISASNFAGVFDRITSIAVRFVSAILLGFSIICLNRIVRELISNLCCLLELEN